MRYASRVRNLKRFKCYDTNVTCIRIYYYGLTAQLSGRRAMSRIDATTEPKKDDSSNRRMKKLSKDAKGVESAGERRGSLQVHFARGEVGGTQY